MTTRCSDHFLQTAGRVAVLVGLVLAMPCAALAAAKSSNQTGGALKLASPASVPEGLSALEWSGIREQYEQQRHAALPTAGGYQARNPGQQWQTRFDGRGFTTKPDGEAWQWGLELTSYGFAGSERAVSGKPHVNTAGPRVTYDWDATLQEWFVNDRRGLEHGFTVRERPNHPGANDREVLECASPLALWNFGEELGSALGFSDGVGRADEKRQRAGALQDAVAPSLNSQPSTLNFLLAVRGGLRPEVQADGRGVRFVDAEGTAALTYSELTVLDADGRKLPARFETVEGSRRREEADSSATEPIRLVTSAATSEENLRLVIDERDARYPLTIDPIAQQAYLKASNTDASENFGGSVAVSGDTVVVGAIYEDSNATGVDGDQSDNSANNAGAAYVFVRNGTNWTQQAYLKASNTEELDIFGCSVAVSGDTVVVGANGEDSSATGVDGDESDNSAPFSGAAYVFVRSGTTWSQQAYLKASNNEASLGVGDFFGCSVAVSGDTVVVGAYREASNATGVDGDQSDNSAFASGAAYIFVRNGTTWSQEAYLKASNTRANDQFGWSVAVAEDTIVVGAVEEDSNATGVNGNQSNNSATNSGAAYVFARSGTNWSQQAYLKASNTDSDDLFGQSVAVSGDTVVVGASGEASNATGVNGNQSNNSATNSGAAYVFVRSGTIWSQQAYLKASNSYGGSSDYPYGDLFGKSVAMSCDTVVVGARGEDSNATGVNGDQSDNGAANSGAAYVFVRNGTTWTQQAYLKASNTGASDGFGSSVAVSGDTLVVGASVEGSNATGVDGDQSDNSAGYSGAAYIFTGLGHGPRLTLAPDSSAGCFLRFTGAPEITYRLQRAPSVTGP